MTKQIVSTEVKENDSFFNFMNSEKATVIDSEGNIGVGYANTKEVAISNAIKDVNRR